MMKGRRYSAEDVALEATDEQVLEIITYTGLWVRGHWYQDQILTVLNRGSFFLKRGEGKFEEVLLT